MNLDFEGTDEAEQIARREMQKRGKRVLILFGISFVLIFGAELLHTLVGIPSSMRGAYWIVSIPIVFILGEAYGWYEVAFQELRTRTKEMNSKLIEIDGKLARIEHEQVLLHEHLQEIASSGVKGS